MQGYRNAHKTMLSLYRDICTLQEKMCSQQGEQGFMRAPTADELCSGCLTCLRACLPGGDEILPVRSHAQKKPIRNLVTARAQACTLVQLQTGNHFLEREDTCSSRDRSPLQNAATPQNVARIVISGAVQTKSRPVLRNLGSSNTSYSS